MTTWLQNFWKERTGAAHAIAVIMLAALAAFNEVPEFHAFVVGTWARAPHWAHVALSILVPLALWYKNNRARWTTAERLEQNAAQKGMTRLGALLILMPWSLCLLLFSCQPPERTARDAIAASKGAIVTVQAKYHEQCVAAPTTVVCEQITRAVYVQRETVNAMRIYCGFTPTDSDSTPCVPVKTALPALRSAVANLNKITADMEALLR